MSETKVPLALAVQNLATLMLAIDEGNLDEAMVKLFTDQRLDLASAVDRRICFFDLCQKHIDSLKEIAKQYELTAKRLELGLEKIKDDTLEIMKTNPDVPYKGELGRLQVQDNASAAVEVFLDTTKKSFINIVDPADIEKAQIPDKFLATHKYYTLVIAEVKKALESGEEIPWAKLRKGQHLRIYRK